MKKLKPTFLYLIFNYIQINFCVKIRYFILFILLFNYFSLNAQSISNTIQDTLTSNINDSIQLKDTIIKIQEPTQSTSKKYIIEGKIIDFTTAEPLSFATVFFPGTSVGLKADIDGNFKFILDKLPKDSLAVTVIGYAKKTIPIQVSSKYLKLKIELERSSIMMRDFVVKFEKDPALNFVKKIIKNKSNNNYDKADNYSYEVYNKLEMDINKIPKKAFSKSPILKEFNFIEKYIDSTSEDKPFLPLFLTETISDYYYQKKPKKTKEFIKGSRISGYENQSVSKMLGSMYQNINIYDNKIPIFNVDFVSPIANDAPSFYKYQFADTQWIDHKLCYQIVFSSKRKGEHTFNGDFWVHDSDYAIQKINMIVTKDENINWVNKVTLHQEFTCLEDTLWFLTKDKFYVDFLPPQGDKIAGFLGRKTTTYKNIIVNNPINEEVVNDKKNKSDSHIEAGALTRNEEYWNSVRHDSLGKNEKAIYQMIDTIQSLPVYKRYYNLFYLIGTGIKEIGPIEIGPIYNLYSQNPVEGSRFRLSLGTTPKLFKNIYLKGYVAYGLLDKRVKYNGSALWILKREPRSYIYAEIKSDIDNTVSQYDEAGSVDNIFNFLGRRKNIPWKLAFVEKQRLEYMTSSYNGFRILLSAERKSFAPYDPLPIKNIFFNQDGIETNAIQTSELGIELRFAYKEQFVEGNYYRTSLGTKYPLVKFFVGQGFKNVLGSDYKYTKFRFGISDYTSIPHAGNLYYNVFAGKIIGKNLPYPLLEIHPGNEFYYYSRSTFSMMHRYEYLSDAYIGANIEHSLGAFIFKYIPLLKKSKIRTFWNMKGVYGSMSSANQLTNLNKGFEFQTLARSPYLEAGTGIENILKVLRIDFVWRILPLNNFNDTLARRFGIFGSVKFDF